MNTSLSVVGGLQCQLGEGLHWDAARNCLWGVDIHGCKVWRWTLDAPDIQAWAVPQRVGWVLPIQGNSTQVLLGLQEGVAVADANTLELLHWQQQPFAANLGMRLNDAKADATGAVWCGSLYNDDESQPLGCLYRLGPNGSWQTLDTGYTVANGPAINASQTVLMHTDSGRRTIYRFALDADAGTLSHKQLWKVFTEREGYPDGMCFDAEGALWVAHWGGGCISRFGPDGELLVRVDLPTSHITNVCFGGLALDRLFVTSACAGLSAVQLASQPLAGRVFEVHGHGVTGLPSLAASPGLGQGW
jgi:xylono-1,5-lactonase